MTGRVALAALVALSAPSTARGASGEDAAPPDRSVYRVDLVVDGVTLLAAGAGVYVPLRLQDSIIDERCPCNHAQVPPFERWVIGHRSQAADVASDALGVASVLVPVGLDALDLGWGRSLLEDVVVFSEALLVNGALVTGVKDLIQRPTPRAYAGDPDIVASPGGYRAMYSGHVSNTVAALTAAAWTARLRHGPARWPWAVVGVVGVGMGLLRIAGGNHFPTDVVVGGAAGFAVGTVVPLLHVRSHGSLSLAPAPGGIALAVRL